MKIWFLIRKVKDDKVREKNEKRKQRMKRHFSERAQPTRDFKNADDADDRLISMNICHHQSKNLALDRWKTKIQMSFKCTEVTWAPLRENPGIFLSYKFTLKKTVSDRKPSALISFRAPSGLCGHAVFIKAKKESLLSVGRLAEILPEKITNWSSIW